MLIQLTASFQQTEKLLRTEQGCYENNVFHSNIRQVGNLLVRHLGEVELVSVCRKRLLTVKLGAQLPCYLGHFSLLLDNQTVAVEPFTRMVKNITSLTEVECRKNPVFVRVQNGLYIGNRGRGMELVQTRIMENEMLEVPVSFVHLVEEREQDLETVEEAELSALAADSHAFTIEVTEDWFVSLYTRSINWLTDSWRHFVMVAVGAGMATMSLLCLCCWGKLCQCIKFSWYPSGQ